LNYVNACYTKEIHINEDFYMRWNNAAGSLSSQNVWSSRYRGLTTGLLLLITGVAFSEMAIATIMPSIASDLNGLAIYGWSFSAFLLANMIGLVLSGSEADHQGPMRPFIIGTTLYVAGLMLSGMAGTMEIFIIARVIQGLGGGFISNIAYVAVSRVYPEQLRPRMLALFSSAWVIPGLVGPGAAGAIAEIFNWRWVFFLLITPMLLSLIMVFPEMKQLSQINRTPRDAGPLVASLITTAGICLLLLGLNKATLEVGVPLVSIGSVVALLAMRNILPAGTYRIAFGLPAAIVTTGLLNMIYFGVESLLPLSLVVVHHQSVAVAGIVLTTASLTWVTGAWIQEHFAFQTTSVRTATVGLLFIAAGISCVIVSLFANIALTLAILGWTMSGLGIGLSFTTLSLVVLKKAPKGQEGSTTASMSLSNALGMTLGAGIGGALIAHVGNSTALMQRQIAIHFVLMLALVVLAIFTAQRMKI
jgi:MFS family permease